MTPGLQLLVLAKAPVPGRVKTRLCPPYRACEAAALAAAALADVLDAVRDTPAARRVLVLDGEHAGLDVAGLEVRPQVAGPLDVRIAAAFAGGAGAPAVLIGMDTPQLTPALLHAAGDVLADTDACLGPADDGGWWALGLRRPDPSVVLGVPCSLPSTGRRQHARLRAAGLSVRLLPGLRDVDVAADADLVASGAPATRFGRLHARLQPNGRDQDRVTRRESAPPRAPAPTGRSPAVPAP